MLNALAALLAALQLCVPVTLPEAVQAEMLSGRLLRFHVVAQDDSAEMQRIKLCVRDAVQTCYAAEARTDEPMLAQAEELLPELTAAALAAARQEGFDGAVDVRLENTPFDDRRLGNMTIPAGDYPALMIRMGDAQGQNWWGLLDPDLSLQLARIPCQEATGSLRWDWSLAGFLSALFGVRMM